MPKSARSYSLAPIFKSDLGQLGYIKNDEAFFYNQIFNGCSGYLIYYFSFELLDINFIEAENEDTEQTHTNIYACNNSTNKRKRNMFDSESED